MAAVDELGGGGGGEPKSDSEVEGCRGGGWMPGWGRPDAVVAAASRLGGVASGRRLGGLTTGQSDAVVARKSHGETLPA